MKKFLKFLFPIFIYFIYGNIVAGQNLPYIDPLPEEIPIVASTPVPDGITPTSEAYRNVQECGFNMCMISGSIDYYKKQFRLIDDLNLKFLIENSSNNLNVIKDIVKSLKNEKKLAGWKIKDEPVFDYLETLKQHYYQIYKDDPNHLIFMNLQCGASNVVIGKNTNYSQYLDYIENLFKPQMLSYDFYPFFISNGKLDVRLDDFFYYLECFSSFEKKYKRPFWTYVQSMAFKNGNIVRPPTNKYYLRFTIFSSLAYGAQGISYWTYGQRNSGKTEKYVSALVNLNGKRTSAWNDAKIVNNEVKKYNHVFKNCNVLNVLHTGDKIYRGTRKLSGNIGPFKMIRSEAAGVLVSYIENKGVNYVVIVNHDVENKQKVTLELISNKNVIDVSSSSKNKEYSWRKDINIKLDKGGYIIFREV